MRIRNLLPLLVPLLLLTGCTAEEQSTAGAGMTPVSLTVSQTGMRAGTAVQSAQFDANESFYVYFPENVTVATTGSHTTYTTTDDSGNTTPAEQPYFNAGATSAAVHAYYPSTVTNSTNSFSVLKDQTGDGNYKASDLMYANIASLSKSDATVTGNLTFYHRMSKIIANVTAGTGVNVINKVRIIGGNRTIAITDPLTCTLSTDAGDLSDAVSDTDDGCVKMYEDVTGTDHVQCAALLPPQTIDGDFLKVETDQGSVTYSLASKALASANSYTFNITVNAAAIGTTVAITGWTDNGNATVNPTVETTNAPDGVEAVDLGLPSGTKWANMNIGAESVTDYGTYFAWGETSGLTVEGHSNTIAAGSIKTHFSWDTYAWCKGSNTTLTKYCPTEKQSSNWWDTGGTTVIADNKTELELADDAARANWGGAWRMPTQDEFDELINNTDKEWVANYNGTGVNGYKFTNKTDNTKFIFLPAAGNRDSSSFDYQGSYGYYWSSTLYSDNPRNAWFLYFYDGRVRTYNRNRFIGYTVRAVLKN